MTENNPGFDAQNLYEQFDIITSRVHIISALIASCLMKHETMKHETRGRTLFIFTSVTCFYRLKF